MQMIGECHLSKISDWRKHTDWKIFWAVAL